jgi:phosphoribosyl-ATP pyrophosphohydrolase/phosphoribosyl-AMP cyclohydrolase
MTETAMKSSTLDSIRWDKSPDGLVPAIVQDRFSKDVLMLGFMNRTALEKTLETGHVTFWTRSKQRLWTKGETSGNVLRFVALRVNCNEDSLLILVEPVGATCHTGYATCFYREAEPDADGWRTISEPQFDPEKVYGVKP